MFKSGTNKSNKIDTLIGKNTKFEGKVSAQGTIRLDGELIGDINIEGSVIIGKKGTVKGNILCNNILVSGTIEGNIDCKEQLRLTNSAKLYGDIKVKSFIVDESAIFEGKCEMQKVHETKNEKQKNSKENISKNSVNKGA